jgi:NhaP-type Na+/H+ or K+/H+ antiporter
MQSHLTQWNLSENSRVLCKGFLELLNFISENLIFCSLGVSLLTYPHLVWKPLFLPIALAIILFARAVSGLVGYKCLT